ncbi:TPPP2, partial [Symbiodinium sp. CCMP2456]
AVLLPGSDDNPEAVFYSFCVPGSLEWDGKCFLKLCRDTDILDDSFTAVDADLTFAKALRKGQRRLSLPQLREALCAVAEKKSVPPSELFEQIAACSGPRLQGTKAKPVRLHAAPTAASVPMASLDSSRTLPTLMSRKPSDGPSSARSSGPGSTKILATAAQAVVAASPSLRQDGTSSYQEVFKAFCGTGRRAMDGPSFSKLCK